MGRVSPPVYWTALLVAAVIAVGAILIVRSDGPQTLSEKLGDLIVGEAVNHSCIGHKASLQNVTATKRPDLYPDLLPRARSAELVACEDIGAVSVVLHFRDRVSLARAFRHSKSGKESGWCLVGSSAFDGALLDHRSSLRRYCARLHGTVRPGPYRLSQVDS
jgi:hypothetical protein